MITIIVMVMAHSIIFRPLRLGATSDQSRSEAAIAASAAAAVAAATSAGSKHSLGLHLTYFIGQALVSHGRLIFLVLCLFLKMM